MGPFKHVKNSRLHSNSPLGQAGLLAMSCCLLVLLSGLDRPVGSGGRPSLFHAFGNMVAYSF